MQMTTWEDPSLIRIPEEILPLTCYNCNISNNDIESDPDRSRLVSFPSYPLLRKNRILVITEFPSMDSLIQKNTNHMYGNTWSILERVFFYLGIPPHYFSYTPIIRCWKNAHTIAGIDEYEKCRNYIKLFVATTNAPAVITLGSMTTKFSFDKAFTEENGKTISLDKLRSSWVNTPFETLYGVPGIPTEHPQSIRLVKCNSQAKFRALCVDFMRAIAYSANIVPEYKHAVHAMNTFYYTKDYEELKKKYETDSKNIINRLKQNGITIDPEGKPLNEYTNN